ncbi:uncharacterized protein LOC122888348 [Siniperca chuatsi]|uniref:uncharacterized protein LOC122888348 n=1 Tax=Siniperca chuatsi TaxID=119488 RepID=UPI001CE12044|nr:uncharacterized protein LOC122888348 [Siniperca chuatsi]XP_044078631.1 uncharacterized protein LOC122888348 [Siniperca chuatsi]XP_044078632.1 uncharacterized protein LOC122888348 [Siniperca chuatsi]XP_044078633.1 uncharacterized protein LOC122888348 [Siniperca chuatsi]XP_044078634.1 uncharacterized protein LOC122888348 [Siniperca chuatsi]
MALRRPLINEERLLMGVAHELGKNRAGAVNYIIERPAEDGLPEVIRIVDVVDEFEEDGHQLMEIDQGQDEDTDDEEEDEDTDDDEDWSDGVSEDSGYDSMYEDEDFEDDDDDNGRPRSPLIQQFPPENVLRGWRPVCPPVPAAVPVAGPVAEPLDVFARIPDAVPQRLMGPPEEGLPSVSQRSDESAASTSGLGSSTKRSREGSDTEQVSAKRQRWNFEESHEESAPSTSGFSFFTNGIREESYRESAPSTSGLSSSTNRRYCLGPFEYQMWADDSDSD